MRIIITGSAGFIGGNLMKALSQNHEVFGLDLEEANKSWRGDLCDSKWLYKYAKKHFNVNGQCKKSIDLIIHMAAMGNISRCNENPDMAWNWNILGFSKVIGLAKATGCRRVLYASSSSVYAGYNEPQKSSLVPRPCTFYAATKAVNEQMAVAAYLGHGIKPVGLRFFNVFGPGQTIKNGHSAFIPLVIDRILKGQHIDLFNEGKNHRAFTPVEYVVDVIKWMLGGGFDLCPPVINVGNTATISTTDVVSIIANAMGKTAAVRAVPKRNWEVESSCADMTREHQLEGFPILHPKTLFLSLKNLGESHRAQS